MHVYGSINVEIALFRHLSHIKGIKPHYTLLTINNNLL